VWWVRYDACGRCSVAGRNNTDRAIWELVKGALDKCDHEITLLVESCHTVSGCGAWIAEVADLWRVSQDIEASWQSVMHNLDAQNAMAAVARAGHYNDPDMLQVGNVGLTQTEWRAMMTMWCLTNAPLFIGTNLHALASRPDVLSILMNDEVLRIQGDLTGGQGRRLSSANASGTELWGKLLEPRQIAMAVLNRGESHMHRAVDLRSLGPRLGVAAADQYTIRDLWQRADMGVHNDTFLVQLDAHEAAIFVLSSDSPLC
jgi:alpha-galactosidase